MKRVLILLACLISVSFGEKTEWYVEFHSDENTIHKIGRDQYNEAIELLNGSEKYEKHYINMLYNESLSYTELPENTEIEGFIHDYMTPEEIKKKAGIIE